MTKSTNKIAQKKISSFVFGASGLVGQAIFKSLPQKKGGTFNKNKVQNCQKFSHKTVTDLKIKSLISNYHHIYYCIALSDPSACKKNPELSRQLNFLLPQRISRLCKAMKKKFIYFSTEYVFKGNKNKMIKESQRPDGTEVYSRHKISAEKYIRKNNKDSLILRLAKIISSSRHDNDFIQKWIASIKKRKELNIFKDQFVKPVHIADVCVWTKKLAKKNCSGVFHLSGDKIFSREVLFKKFVKKEIKKKLQKKLKYITCPSSLPKSLFLSNKKVKKILKR